MNLSDEKVSQAMAELMGVCWHIDDPEFQDLSMPCPKCGQDFWTQFSAFTPDGIFAWKSYMEKEMPEEWEKYIFIMFDRNNYAIDIFNAQLNPHNLVDWLYDNLEDWGYWECEYRTKCNEKTMAGCTKYISRTDCFGEWTGCENGTGEVLTEKARKFKAIVEGEG
jgi:hypothetical protein